MMEGHAEILAVVCSATLPSVGFHGEFTYCHNIRN